MAKSRRQKKADAIGRSHRLLLRADLERVIGSVRVEVPDAQLARRLFGGTGLLGQGGDGVSRDLLVGGIVGGDQLVEVLAVIGAVDQGLQLGFGRREVGLERAVGLGIGLGHQGGQAWASQGGAVDLLVLAQVDVANAFAVVEVRVVGVVAEAVVLVFGGVGFQRDLHALAGQF